MNTNDNVNRIVFAFAFGSFFAAYHIYQFLKKRREIKLEAIWVYPVKSCKGILVDKWPITSRGLQYDREFMVTDANGKFLSQRSHPKMALIECFIDSERDILRLSAPGLAPLEISLNNLLNHTERDILDVTVWGDVCKAYDMGMDCANWFNRFLSIDNARLFARFRSSSDRLGTSSS